MRKNYVISLQSVGSPFTLRQLSLPAPWMLLRKIRELQVLCRSWGVNISPSDRREALEILKNEDWVTWNKFLVSLKRKITS